MAKPDKKKRSARSPVTDDRTVRVLDRCPALGVIAIGSLAAQFLLTIEQHWLG